MKHNNKYLSLVGVVAAISLTGCPAGGPPFPQPENTAVVNFTIDASGRPGFYEDGDLEWKGSFTYDETSRILTYDSSWAGGAGPYAPVYDDGPWDQGGHEPLGATAGDDEFGIAAFIAIPEEEITLGYGAQTCCGATGGWIWSGTDGSVAIAPSATTVNAEGLELTPFGDVDLRLTLDTNNLGSDFAASTDIKVKGTTFSDWSTVEAFDDGTHGDATSADGIYTYTLSADDERRGLASGSTVEFIWTIGGTEYKTTGGAGETTGVKAYTKAEGEADFTERTVIISDPKNNTAIAVP